MTGEPVDDCADFDQPYTRWAVLVVYPQDCGGVLAGQTARLGRQERRVDAERRRDWHLNNGAVSAVVERQVWTPSPWEQVD